MAAALIIPIVTAIVPAVVPLFVKLAEKIFAGHKTGLNKLDWVTTATSAIEKGHAAGWPRGSERHQNASRNTNCGDHRRCRPQLLRKSAGLRNSGHATGHGLVESADP
jgi:hypothetical protein